MTNLEKISAALFFIVVCVPPDARADEQNHGCVSTRQVQCETGRFLVCHDRQEKMRNPPLSPVISSNDECDRKLLEELVKNATECLKDLDRQADILEKLLLKSPPPMLPVKEGG